MRLKLFFLNISIMMINALSASTSFEKINNAPQTPKSNKDYFPIRRDIPKQSQIFVMVLRSQDFPHNNNKPFIVDGHSPVEELCTSQMIPPRNRSSSVDMNQNISPMDIISRLIQEENIQRSNLITQEVYALSAVYDIGTQHLQSIITKQQSNNTNRSSNITNPQLNNTNRSSNNTNPQSNNTKPQLNNRPRKVTFVDINA
jgi:hypothetical protein